MPDPSGTAVGRSAVPLVPGPREWAGLALLSLPCVVVAMDLTVLNLAVPTLSADLRPGPATLLWIIDVYGFLLAAGLLTMGVAGDRWGRRRMLLIGAAAFAVASVLAATARDATQLIAARALLGIAGAALLPSSLALVTALFPDPRRRALGIGVWTAAFSVGGVLGPLVGGLVLTHWSWPAIFLAGIPPMLLVLAGGAWLLPEVRRPDGGGGLDGASVVLSLVAVIAVVFGIKRLAESGPGPVALLALAGGVSLAAAFLRRQSRLAVPFVDLAAFRTPVFGAALAISFVSCFLLFATYLVMAQHLQLVLGLDPLSAGLWTLPSSLAYIAGAGLCTALTGRLRPGTVIAGGFVVAAAGFVVFGLAGDSLAGLVTGSVLFSAGLAPGYVLGTATAMEAAPEPHAGTAAALSETSTELGSAAGIAVLGSLAAALYRLALDGAAPPKVPAPALAAARDTLGAGVDAARSLPGTAGDALAAAARNAHLSAAGTVALVTGVLSLLAAAAAHRLLRDRRATPANGTGPDDEQESP